MIAPGAPSLESIFSGSTNPTTTTPTNPNRPSLDSIFGSSNIPSQNNRPPLSDILSGKSITSPAPAPTQTSSPEPFTNPKTPAANALGNFATSTIPSIPAPFQSSPSDSTIVNAGKTLGNMATDTVNLGTGIVNFLNPFKNIGDIINNAKEIGIQLGEESARTGESPWSILGKAMADPNAGDAVISAVVPKFLQQIGNGDFAGAQKTLTENPVTSIAPMLLVASGAAQKMGMSAEFDNAMTKISEPVIKPVKSVVFAATDLAGKGIDIAKQGTDIIAKKAPIIGSNATDVKTQKAVETAKQEWNMEAGNQKGKAATIFNKSEARNIDIPKVLTDRGITSYSLMGDNGKFDTGAKVTELHNEAATLYKANLGTLINSSDEMGVKVPLADIKQQAIDYARGYNTTSGNIDDAVNKINKEFNNPTFRAAQELKVGDMESEKTGHWNEINWNKTWGKPTAENIFNDAMGHAYQSTIESTLEQQTGLPKGTIKEMNAEIGKIRQTADFLQQIDGDKPAAQPSKTLGGKILKSAIKVGAGTAVDTLGGGGAGALGGYILSDALAAKMTEFITHLPEVARSNLLKNMKAENPEVANQIQQYIQNEATQKSTRLALPQNASPNAGSIAMPENATPEAVIKGKENIQQPPFKSMPEAKWKEVVDGIHQEINNSIKRNTNQPSMQDVQPQKNLPPLNSIMKEGTTPNSRLIRKFRGQ